MPTPLDSLSKMKKDLFIAAQNGDVKEIQHLLKQNE